MNKEHSEELVAMAPYMFEYNQRVEGQPLYPISFGFECGDGWFNILKELITKLKDLDQDQSLRIIQVKEKFGALRFYINWGSDEIYNEITKAEILSEAICENCGKDGRLRGGSWVKTLCDECNNG